MNFQNILDNIRYVLSTDFPSDTLAILNNYHRRFISALFYAVLVVAGFGTVFNLIGLYQANIILAILIAFISIIIATRPTALIPLSIIGISLQDDKTLPEKLKNAIVGVWFLALGHTTLWISIILLAAGTISFKNNPRSITIIFLVMIIFALMDFVWGMKVKIAKRLIYLYCVVALIVSFLLLIPRSYSYKFLGFCLHDTMAVSKVDRLVYEAKDINKTIKEDIDAAFMTTYIYKLNHNIASITSGEQKRYEELLKQRNEHTVTAVTGRTAGSILDSIKKFFSGKNNDSTKDYITYYPGDIAEFHLTGETRFSPGCWLIASTYLPSVR